MFMAAGGKGTGIEFASFVYEILFQYPDETLLIDILNFPELHVMLGIVQKLLDYIKLLSSTSFIESYLKAFNITETFHRGKKGLQKGVGQCHPHHHQEQGLARQL